MWSKEKLKQNYGFCLQGKIQLIFGEKRGNDNNGC